MANKKKGEIEERILVYMEKIEQHQKDVKEAQAKKAEETGGKKEEKKPEVKKEEKKEEKKPEPAKV